MVAVGIDPSLKGTGICWGDYTTDTLSFRGRKGDPRGDERMAFIRKTLNALYEAIHPNIVCIESVPPYTRGAAALGLAHGVVREVTAAHGIELVMAAPSVIKKFATGSGRSGKEEMLLAMRTLNVVPSEVWIHWDDNAVDAWWLRQIALAYKFRPNHGFAGYDVRPVLEFPSKA